MIDNFLELKVAIRNLRIFEGSLRSLREQLEVESPWLLEASAKAYLARIATLQGDITQYLQANPAELSLVLPPAETVVQAEVAAVV